MKRVIRLCLILGIFMLSACQEEPGSKADATGGESVEYKNDLSKVSVTGGYQTDFNLTTLKAYANLSTELKAVSQMGIEYSKYSDMSNSTQVKVSSIEDDNSYSIEITGIDIGTKIYYRSFVKYVSSGFYEYGETRSFVWRTIDIPDEGAVDLGLSVKWAACDLGAGSPVSTYGDYYAWGETESKNKFTKSNYKYYKNGSYTKYNATDKKQILDLSDDAAHAQLGGKWRIPTRYEFEELVNALHRYCPEEASSGAPNNNMKCYLRVMYKGVEGRLYVNQTAKYSNVAIFTPEDSYYIIKETTVKKSKARTWCSTTHSYYYCLKDKTRECPDDDYVEYCYWYFYDTSGGNIERWEGLKIRPVWDDNIK